MFLLEIEDLLLEQIAKMASSSGVPMKTVAQLALVKGLAELEAMGSKEILEIRQKVEQDLGKDVRFITDNWQKMSDGEMATELGLSVVTVSLKRRRFGFSRRRGPHGPRLDNGAHDEFIKTHWKDMSDSAMATELGISIGAVRSERRKLRLSRRRGPHGPREIGRVCDKFIEANWKKMSDEEMATKLGLAVATVIRRRCRLGLLRPDRRKKEDWVDKVDGLRYALLEGGETAVEFRKRLGLKVSKQRIKQVCQRHGIDLKDRKPAWYARRYRCAVLAEKDSLIELLRSSGSLVTTYERLGVGQDTFKTVLRLHGIDLKDYSRGRAPRVELTCANSNCGEKFLRLRRNYDLAKKKNPNYVPYCSKYCFGQVMGKTYGLGKKKVK